MTNSREHPNSFLENHLIEQKWITRARETYNFHRRQLMSNDKWTLAMTAKALKRGLGPISEDILIAKWLKTHSAQIEKFEYACEALDYIRKRARELELSEL